MNVVTIVGRVLGRHRSLPERAGVLSGSAIVGQTFARGLLPRTPVHQAAITGTSAVLQYSSTTIMQSLIYDVAERVTQSASTERRQVFQRQSLVIGANAVAIGAGLGVQYAFRHRKNEAVSRAVLRTVGGELARAGAAGALVAAGTSALDRAQRGIARDIPVAAPLGGAIAAGVYLYRQQQDKQFAAETTDALGRPVGASPMPDITRSLAIGAGVSVGMLLLARGEQLISDQVAQGIDFIAPGLSTYRRPIGHVVALGLYCTGLGYAVNLAYSRTQAAGLKKEAAYASIPDSVNVSGSAASVVPFDTLGREGRRWVSMVLRADEIESVMGESAVDPIRVFVGLESYPGIEPSGRVRLAMEELERTGAFDRPIICVCSPTGTGYVNAVMSESLEYYARGDVASVAIQYSVRPSFLSLQAVHIARDGMRLLLTAINARISAMPAENRPRVIVFGESLGAQSGQDVLAGSRKNPGRPISAFAEDYGVERLFFIGTPFGSKWHGDYVADPERYDPAGQLTTVASYDEWLALDDEKRGGTTALLLSHHTDPITKFGPILIVQRPDWLGPVDEREPGVPHSAQWRFWVTFISTFIDVLNADLHKPGIFEARGHDYSLDLPRMTAVAFGLPVSDEQLSRADVALRERQLLWAQKREVSQELADAVDRIEEQLDKWGTGAASELRSKLDHLTHEAALEAE